MAIQFFQMSFSYGEEDILKDITLSIQESGFVIILGKSGCGKTTLLSLISGVLKPTSGSITTNNDIALLFQSPLLIDYLNVKENILFPVKINGDESSHEQRLKEVLEKVHLIGYEKRDVQTLSGGEQTRVSLARALIQNKHTFLLDEPTGQLDEKTSLEIYQLFKELSKDHLILLVTHDEKNALSFADTVYEIKEKKLHILKESHKENNFQKKTVITNKSISLKSTYYIIKKSLSKKYNRVLFSCLFLAIELSLAFLGLIFPLNLSKFTTSILKEHYAYETIKINERKKVNTDSPLILEKDSIPKNETLFALNIPTIYPSLNYFIPESYEVTLNQIKGVITLIPFFVQKEHRLLEGAQSKKGNEVIINSSFAKQFKLTPKQCLNQHIHIIKETLFAVPNSNLTETISFDEVFYISGVGKEKTFLNQPILYYDYFQIKKQLDNIYLPKISQAKKQNIYLKNYLDINTYRNQDFLNYEAYFYTDDPFFLKKNARQIFKDTVVIESNPIQIQEGSQEVTAMILKVINAFLILNAVSAFLLEFLCVLSLYDDNIRFFALLKVFASSKKTKSKFIFILSFIFSGISLLFFLLFILLIFFIINVLLSSMNYPIFFTTFSLRYFLILTIILFFLSYLASLLPLKRLRQERIKKELEGED